MDGLGGGTFGSVWEGGGPPSLRRSEPKSDREREGEKQRGEGGVTLSGLLLLLHPINYYKRRRRRERERERERERRNGESGWRRRDLLRQPSTSHRNAPVYNKYTKVNISFFYQESTWMYYCFQAERETEAHRWANSELRNRNGVFGRGREFEAAADATFPPGSPQTHSIPLSQHQAPKTQANDCCKDPLSHAPGACLLARRRRRQVGGKTSHISKRRRKVVYVSVSVQLYGAPQQNVKIKK